MAIDKLTIRIDTPSDTLPIGRGFYQIEEDTLFVPIGVLPNSRHAFFSFLESGSVRLDVDKSGSLLFMEISKSRRLWEVVAEPIPPAHAPYADIRWLDFRENFPEPRLITNPGRNLVCVEFSDRPALSAYSLAESVKLEIDDSHAAVRIWVTEIVDDLAGRLIAAVRHPDLER
jgi:hypothetical protein